MADEFTKCLVARADNEFGLLVAKVDPTVLADLFNYMRQHTEILTTKIPCLLLAKGRNFDFMCPDPVLERWVIRSVKYDFLANCPEARYVVYARMEIAGDDHLWAGNCRLSVTHTSIAATNTATSAWIPVSVLIEKLGG